jgi:intracellular sulfur oxidation DsrE/DsrF family protein
MKKKLFVALSVLFFSINLFSQSNSKPVKIKHQVVIQLSSNDTLVWKGLMNNIKNLKNAWGDTVAIEVVVHGPGIELLMSGKTTQLDKIGHFRSKGVVFLACENTLAERKISKESIIQEAGFVKSAIVEIINRQEKGWTYIKAGF